MTETEYQRQFLRLPPQLRAAANVRADINAEVLRKVAAMWNPKRPMDPNVWFDLHALAFAEMLTQAQLEVATVGIGSVDTALALQDYTDSTPWRADPGAFAGITGSGHPVMGIAYAQALRVVQAIDAGADTVTRAQTWEYAGLMLQVATQTAIADANRMAKLTHLYPKPKTKWIRIVRPPCCARCAILAGKIGGDNMDFQRHPRCDCDAIPISEETSDMHKLWHFGFGDYFDSLSTTEQNRIFTTAGAQAIRDGADPAQVVNARRGMSRAGQAFGRKQRTTTEGTTRRGQAAQYLQQQYRAKFQKSSGRYMRVSQRRLMPEEIYRIAGGDKDRALVLLHKNGYLLDASAGLDGKNPRFRFRDAQVAAAGQRVSEKIRLRTVKEVTGVSETSGLSPPPPPPPPRKWSKATGGDDDFREKYFEDLRLADLRVPVEHIIGGKVRKNRIVGAHDFERRAWVRERVLEGAKLPSKGKTFFPKLKGGTDALIQWLGTAEDGVITKVLRDPEAIEGTTQGFYRVSREVVSPDGHRFVLSVFTGAPKNNSPHTFKVATAFPPFGQGVTEVLADGSVRTRYRLELPW